jgi:aryl-alcohol dehydrogenase-like predicted oxidoreductase
MKRTTFGKTELQVSSLGFGAAPIGFLKTDIEAVGTILNHLLDSGVNLIDTAAGYQGSEAAIGQTVGHRRKEFVLVSKCGMKVPDVDGSPFSPGLISATVDRSLRNLQTDSLDVMLLHSCTLDVLKKGEALKALLDAQKAGKIRFVGYSGDNEAAAYAASLPDIAVIETSVSFIDQANIDHVLPACVENNVGVLAKRPIGNACWKPLESQSGFYQSYVKPYTERFKKLDITPADLGFQGDASAAWAELAMRFTLSQHGLNTAIIGTTNLENARKNIDVAAKGPLPADVVSKLRDAFKKAQSTEKWAGLT